MLNCLIADDNIYYAKHLIEQINSKNEDVRVVNISIDGEETLKILNESNDIDIFLLDLKMPKLNGNDVLRMLNEERKEKYENSCLVISAEPELAMKLSKDNSIIYSIIMKSQYDSIALKINELIELKRETKKENNLKKKILYELQYLGFNIAHIGTKYMNDAIYYIIKEKNGEINNLKKEVYPIIAKMNKVNANNIKQNIIRANETMYYMCENKKLKEYFFLQDESKPNTKMIINTIITKIIY